MLFAFKAKSEKGEVIEGFREAEDRFTLASELKSERLTPLSISEKNNSKLSFQALFGSFFNKVKIEEQIIFTKNLSGMLNAGLSLARALSVLKKQTRNPKMIKIVDSIANEINTGGTLSSGLQRFPEVFSRTFVAMTKAGEESGNLSGALGEIGLNIEKSHKLARKVRNALIYPGVILSAMVLIGILMFAFVVPTLATTFRELGVELPVATQFVVVIGNFFSQHLFLSLFLAIVSMLGLVMLFRAPFMNKYVDFIVTRLPVVGEINIELNTARTTRTMASLLTSGVSITRAIEITEEVVQNIYYKKVLAKARIDIEKGAPFSKVFEENPKLYPVMMTEMLEVGEETGKLAEMLLQVANFYEGEIENKTKNLSVIIEPVLMVLIGGAVGFFAISMISPLYSILDSIQ